MAQNKQTLLTLFSSLIPHKAPMALAVSGEKLEITAGHKGIAHHAIEDIDIQINGMSVVEEEYSTRITDTEEVVTVVLPFEPKPGDVIVVDTEVHRLGSKKITLKVE